MSWSTVRDFFRTKLDALDFNEHDDAFNSENIPSTLLDKSYFIGPATISQNSRNQLDLDTGYGLTIQLAFKGYRCVKDALDTSLEESETFVKNSVQVCEENIVNAGFVSVSFNGLTQTPLSDTNDNTVLVNIEFVTRVILNPES